MFGLMSNLKIQMEVTKNDIDNYFTSNYNNLITLATNNIRNKPTKELQEPSTYVNECYMHLLTNIQKIPSIDKIANFAYKYIIDEIRWTNSKVNRTNKIVEQYNAISPSNEQTIDLIDESTNLDTINLLLDEMDDYNKKKAAIQIYISECNAVDKILFEVYTENNGMSCRKMGAHFKISSVSAWAMIKKMKNRINEIYSSL